MCLKAWGSIQLSNIKNVCLTYERTKLIFDLFSLSMHGNHFCLTFRFTYISCTWKSWKWIPSSNHLVKITKSIISTLKLIKIGRIDALSTMSSLHSIFHSHKIWTRVKKNSEKSQKQRNEWPWTLPYTLVLQTMSSPWSFFFSIHT